MQRTRPTHKMRARPCVQATSEWWLYRVSFDEPPSAVETMINRTSVREGRERIVRVTQFPVFAWRRRAQLQPDGRSPCVRLPFSIFPYGTPRLFPARRAYGCGLPQRCVVGHAPVYVVRDVARGNRPLLLTRGSCSFLGKDGEARQDCCTKRGRNGDI